MDIIFRLEEQEMKKIAEQRRREKMEEKLARYHYLHVVHVYQTSHLVKAKHKKG